MPTPAKETTSLATAFASTLAIFLVAMDAVMMPIATSALTADLQTNVGTVQAAIAIASLVAAPLYITGGKLGDIYGKKRIFVTGMAIYGVGTLAATITPSAEILIAGWSIVRGLGMALALPASVGLIFAAYSDESQRGQAFAIYGIGGVAAALVGPLLMGFSADSLSWRVPFGLETLVAATAVVFALRVMRETEPVKGASIDWIGTIIYFIAIASILLGSMLGGRYGWLEARRAFIIGDVQINPLGLSPAPVLIGIGIVVMALLVSRLDRITERPSSKVKTTPLFSMKLFDDRVFLVTSLMAMIFFVLTGALPFIIPVFLQQTVGFDGVQTALTMIAFSIGSIILGFASGSLIQRLNPRTVIQIFLSVAAAGMIWLFTIVSPDVTLLELLLPMFTIGAGFGVISSQLPNIQLSGLSAELRGEGSGLAESGKELGGGLGTAVIASIMFSLSLGGTIDAIATRMDLQISPDQRSGLVLELEDQGLPYDAAALIEKAVPDAESVVKQAQTDAFQGTLGILTGIILLSLLIASFIPAKKENDTNAKAKSTR